MCLAFCDPDSMLSTKKLSTISLNRLELCRMTDTPDVYYTEINCALRETIPCDMSDSYDASSHRNCAPSQIHCTIKYIVRSNHNSPSSKTQQPTHVATDSRSSPKKRNRLLTNIRIPSKFVIQQKQTIFFVVIVKQQKKIERKANKLNQQCWFSILTLVAYKSIERIERIL